MDIISEQESKLDPIEVTPEAIESISAAIEETAQARAQQKVAAIGDELLRSIQQLKDGCTGASPQQIASDVKEKIILPVLLGQKVTIPDWILEAERVDILNSAKNFIGNTRERFSPLPYGVMKISNYRISEFMKDHKVSVVHEPSREEGDIGEWVAHSHDGVISRGEDPSDAVNNLFMKFKAVKKEGVHV